MNSLNSSSLDGRLATGSTLVPLEIIEKDNTELRAPPDGHDNPEFINGNEEEDDDIYKAQLLLFLKQSHLINPGLTPGGDNSSDTSDFSRTPPRRASRLSEVNGRLDEEEETIDEGAVELDSIQVSEDVSCVDFLVYRMRNTIYCN